MRQPIYQEHLFSVFPSLDTWVSDDDQGASRCQQGKCSLLCLFERNRVKYVRDRDVGDVDDVVSQRGGGKRPIEDVCGAEGDEQVFVVQGRCRDDRRETGELCELDGCMGRSVWVRSSGGRSLGVHTVLSEGGRASHNDDGLVRVLAEAPFFEGWGESQPLGLLSVGGHCKRVETTWD